MIVAKILLVLPSKTSALNFFLKKRTPNTEYNSSGPEYDRVTPIFTRNTQVHPVIRFPVHEKMVMGPSTQSSKGKD